MSEEKNNLNNDEIKEKNETESLPEKVEEVSVVQEDSVVRKKKSKGVLKYIIAAIVLLVAVRAGVEFFSGNEPSVTETEITGQMELDTSSKYDFAAFGKNLVTANKYGIFTYDINGKTKWSVETNLTTPTLRTKGKYLIVTDTAQNLVRTFDRNGKMQAEIKFDTDCINASVNENGWVVAILKLKGYRAQVAVYDEMGNLKYNWNSANNDVISAELAADNKTLAVSQLDSSSSAEANGIISFFDITTEGKPYSGKNTESNLVTYIRWSGSNLICVGSNSVFKLDKSGKDLWKYEYPGEMLVYNAHEDSVMAFAVNGNTTSASKRVLVYTINDDGKELGYSELEGDVRNIEIKNNKIVVVGANSVTTLHKDGTVKEKKALTRDVSRGVLFENGSEMFVVSGTSGETISVG